MSIGRATVLSLGFVGAVALGMWIGPNVLSRDAAGGPAKQTAASTATRPASGAATLARTSMPAAVVPASEPALQKRLKDVLNQGTNVQIAAEGFRNGEQFAAVAHAARNTGVPFMVLKDRVVAKRMSLAAALRDVKPDVNAAAEANRARTMARADVAAVSG
ncbi:MAG TPA: hypothetical protein VES67_14990 [Vicinamibacterales bacterium]|nr:hypothetical protein [Vicinamibacterales bacterium]